MNKNTLLLCTSAAVILGGCVKNDSPSTVERSEYIKVYDSSSKKAVDAIQVPLDGIKDGQIHIISNVELQWRTSLDVADSAEDSPWLTIKEEPEKKTESGYYDYVVTYDAESLLALNSLGSRSERLSFFCPSSYLGKFLTIRQGYDNKFYEEFDDKPGKNVTVSNRQAFTTGAYSELSKDYFDYISFNAWAETENEFRTRNITLDITISGGLFYETRLATYRVNVPLGTAADKSNLKYLLIMGDGDHLSNNVTFTFSTANDDLVYVHIDNFAAYTVTESELGYLYEDEGIEYGDEIEWE